MRRRLLLSVVLLLALPSGAAAETWVQLRSTGLDVPVVQIDAGDEVHFSSTAGTAWEVTADDGTFASGPIGPQGEFTVAPTVPGTHRFSAGGARGALVVRGTALPGTPGGGAQAAIPDIAFPPADPGLVGTDPATGVEASMTRIVLGPRPGATVAQVNAALTEADVRVIGGDPRLGVLLVETAAADAWSAGFDRLRKALAALRGAPGIDFAAMSTVVRPTAVPRRADDDVPEWDWDAPEGRGNAWLAAGRFPQAWNLLESVRRKRPAVVTGVVDTGFAAHEDLPGLDVRTSVCAPGALCEPIDATEDDHGTHVAGIIGADFDADGEATGRSRGVSGGNPVAKLMAWSADGFGGGESDLGDVEGVTLSDQQLRLLGLVLRSRPPGMRVLNHSMSGVSLDAEAWAAATQDETCGPGARDDDLPLLDGRCTPDNLDAWQLEIANAGRAAAAVAREASRAGILLVQAAGDDGATLGAQTPVSAASDSELGWVAEHWEEPGIGDGGANPVITVGSITASGTRSAFSAIGADISAPGEDVVSTITGDDYGALSGTSMAAAQVTAVAGLLAADEPGITVAAMRKRLLEQGRGRAGAAGGPAFDYTIPDRVNLDVDGDSVVDVPRSQAVIAPERWDVDLDACAASMPGGAAVASYSWSAEGEPIGSTSSCRMRWRPTREGLFDVTLTVTGADGQSADVTRVVDVEDTLIMSVGDSIASGEGQPDVPSPWGWDSARWQYPRCHRSAFAGPAQAARTLEGADDRSSITFVHVACSGARMAGDTEGTWSGPDPAWSTPETDGEGLTLVDENLGIGGLLSPYEGIQDKHPSAIACLDSGRTDLSNCERPQLDQLKTLVGEREPDALLVSIGANDMTFSKILMDCMFDVFSPLTNCTESPGGRGVFENRIRLLPRRYARLNEAIRDRWPNMDRKKVIITQYPDLTKDEHGVVNLSCGIAKGITQAEARWAHEIVLPSLNGAVAAAAASYGWTLATGIPEAFHGHGYCADEQSWIVGIGESFSEQDGKDGGFHPNYAGHEIYASSIRRALRSALDLPPGRPSGGPRDRGTTLDAFRALAAGAPAARWADVNDPSEDGNRRLERTVQADGAVTEKPDHRSGLGEGERTAPDGRVDMRDLRRVRDAWLQTCLAGGDGCPAAGDIDLDGGAQHPKRDLNLDGCVTGGEQLCGARESRFSRFDLNGDGVIDPARKAAVPWAADGTTGGATAMTDADVLEAAWTGGTGAEGWAKGDVDELLRSGDVEVHADAVLDAGAAKAVVQARRKDGAPVGPERTVRRRDGSIVMTLPVTSTTAELELVATSQSADGEMTSKSDPFTLRLGQDRVVAVCPDLTIKASRHRVPADGTSTSIITARVGRCGGRDVAGHAATFTLEPAGGGATIAPVIPVTDAAGRATARFTAGQTPADSVVRVSVDMGEDAEPLTARLDLTTIPELTIKYLWTQEIVDWHESGTTRWPLLTGRPNCLGASAVDYCIDAFQVGLRHQRPGGIKRAGTLVGGGDRFALTEEVRDSQAGSASSWSVSFKDDRPPVDGSQHADWFVENTGAYTDTTVAGVGADEEADGAVRVRGIQAVGDLPYTYRLTGSNASPQETHAATSHFLLVPPGQGRIRFAAQPDEDLRFAKAPDGRFRPFTSCGVLKEDLTSQPGYYVPGTNDYIPGAMTVGRKSEYVAGDRPVPAGPGRIEVRYRFAAVATYPGQVAPALTLPECGEDGAPTAAMEVDPAGDGPAREGSTVTFRSRSTDPDNDIRTTTWDFGDGKSAIGTTAWHMYEDDGTYVVRITVEDAKGKTATTTQEVVVRNEAPEAEIDDATGTDDQVVLRYRMLDPGHVDKGELRWTLTSTNPVFAPASGTDKAGVWWRGPFEGLPAGTYPLTLTVTDKDGASASAQAVLVVTGTPPPPAPEPEPVSFRTCDDAVTLDAEERTFLDVVNALREEHGLQPVTVSATLTRAADVHAKDMAVNDYMDHVGKLDKRGFAERAWAENYPKNASMGENLAEGATADDVLWAWRGSRTGHNENLLNPAWRAVGIARANGSRWRWATTYGSLQDCPAAVPERLPAAPMQLTRTTGGTEVHTAEGEVDPQRLPEPEAAPAPEVTRSTLVTADEPAPAAPRLHAPATAVVVAAVSARGDRPYPITNRSRDAAGTPVPAVVDPGDGSAPFTLAPGEVRAHRFPVPEWRERRTLRATATDDGRSTTIERRTDVFPDGPPWMVFTSTSAPAVAGAPYEAEVTVTDDGSGERLPGLRVTFSAPGATPVTVTTDGLGRAKGAVVLGETLGDVTLTASVAATDDVKASTKTKGLWVQGNTAPVADAGGPYVIGEGRSLLLDGSRSADPDPADLDRIVAWDWDLDGDGAFDDASGRLPAALTAEELEERMCAGPCAVGVDHPVALRVTDAWAKTHTDTATVRLVGDFELSLLGGGMVVEPGSPATYAVTVVGSRSFTTPVHLEAIDLPAGVEATFSPNPIVPSGASVLTLTATSGSGSLQTPVKVRGTAGTVVRDISGEVTVGIGLTRECFTEMSGTVTDRSGAPLAGAVVRATAGWSSGLWPVTTDAGGRWRMERVPLGWNNTPLPYAVSAEKDGFWSFLRQDVVARCGEAPVVDASLLDVRKGAVKAKVIDKQTRKPVPAATVTEHVCAAGGWPCGPVPVTTADRFGRWSHQPTLDAGNAERAWYPSVVAPGYWRDQHAVRVSEGTTTQATFELLKQCYGRVGRGTVVNIDTKRPVPDVGVAVYLNGDFGQTFNTRTDQQGQFVVDREIMLAEGNTLVRVRAQSGLPTGAPAGSQSYPGHFEIDECGEVAGVTLQIKVPERNYGTLTGRLTDEEGGAPLPDRSVTICDAGCRSVQTNDKGEYRFERVFVGFDTTTTSPVSIRSSKDGWYDATDQATVVKDQVADAGPMTSLRKRTGRITVKVVDAVTGAPVPTAQVFEGSDCVRVCKGTDRNGVAVFDEVALNDRNAPRHVTLKTTAPGFWELSKAAAVRAGETTAYEFRLLPECTPARVSGTVVAADTQAPIEGASVRASGGGQVLTNAQGRFVITDVQPGKDNVPTTVGITASASGFVTKTVWVRIFCGADLTVDFGRSNLKTGTVVATLKDADTGAVLQGAFVGTSWGADATTGAGGTARFTEVPLGPGDVARDWKVTGTPAGYRPVTRTVTVQPTGESAVELLFSKVNAAPSAAPKTVTLAEDAEDVPVTLGGSDPDGDPVTAHVLTWPQHGVVTGKAPDLRFWPDDDWHGTDTFTYAVSDGEKRSEPVTVQLIVTPVPDAAYSGSDHLTGLPDQVLRIPKATLFANDGDPDGEPLVIREIVARNGSQVAQEGDDVVFTPPPGWDRDGNYAFLEYWLEGGTGSSYVYITVKSEPGPPTCVDRAFSTRRGAALTKAFGCTDKEGDALTYEVVSPPAQGTVELVDGGAFRWTPPPAFAGVTTFTFKARDASGPSAVRTVTLTAVAENTAPVCQAATAGGEEDVPVDVPVTCTDADGQAVTIELVDGPATGTVAPQGGGFRFTGPANGSGRFTFRFRATDGEDASAPATATVTLAPVDDAPVCRDVAFTADKGPGEATPDCTDVEDAALSYEIAEAPAAGAATVAGGKLRFVPAAGQEGAATFRYRARDAGGTSAPALATVTVVPRPNAAPVCEAATASGREDEPVDVDVTCTDADGDALAVTLAEGPAAGTATVRPGGFRFTAPANRSGPFTFTFRAGDGRATSAPATATVTLAPVDDAPVCRDVRGTSGGEAVDVAPDCSDVEDDPLTFEVVGGPATLVEGRLRTTPAADATGPVVSTYRARAAGAASAPATLTVVVARPPANRAPAAADDDVVRQPSGGVLLVPLADLLANDTDADGDALRVTAVDGAERATATLEADAVRVVPEQGFAGIARFRYTVTDAKGATAQATVFLRIDAVAVAGEGQQGAPAPTSTPRPAPAPPLQGTPQLLACANRPVVLEDVVPARGRVRLVGIAGTAMAGRRVVIRRLPGRVVVARPRVGADGRFAASAPMPARYVAALGDGRSATLKLWRRMRVESVRTTAAGVRITGRITGPLARRVADRVIEVREQVVCADGEVVARVRPDARGRFSVLVPRGKGAAGAVYRLHARVRATRRSPKLFDTWTLPRAVDF